MIQRLEQREREYIRNESKLTAELEARNQIVTNLQQNLEDTRKDLSQSRLAERVQWERTAGQDVRIGNLRESVKDTKQELLQAQAREKDLIAACASVKSTAAANERALEKAEEENAKKQEEIDDLRRKLEAPIDRMVSHPKEMVVEDAQPGTLIKNHRRYRTHALHGREQPYSSSPERPERAGRSEWMENRQRKTSEILNIGDSRDHETPSAHRTAIQDNTGSAEKLPIEGAFAGNPRVRAAVEEELERTVRRHLRQILEKKPSLLNGLSSGSIPCLHKKSKKLSSVWAADEEKGTYACKACVNNGIPCLRALDGVIVVLPLLKELRVPTDCKPGSMTYHICKDEDIVRSYMPVLWTS